MNKKCFFSLVALLLVVSTLVFYYGQPQANSTANQTTLTTEVSDNPEKAASYQNISAKELNDWITSDKDLLLIDVREPNEFKAGYLQGAVNIPLGQLEKRLKEIPQVKTVVVYCRSGRRSAEAASILVKNGYTKIINLEGGIMSWPYQVVQQQTAIAAFRAA